VRDLSHIGTEASGGLIAAKPAVKCPCESDLIVFGHACMLVAGQ
jgi:hypothetical protein